MEPHKNESWELAESLAVCSMILGKPPNFWGPSFSFCKMVKMICYIRIWSVVRQKNLLATFFFVVSFCINFIYTKIKS